MIRPNTKIANTVADHLQGIKDQAARAIATRPLTVAQGIAGEPPISIRQLLLNATGQEFMTFMEPAEVFDHLLIGGAEVDGETVAVYNKLGVVAALADHRNISMEEAFDAFTQSRTDRGRSRLDSGKQMPKMPIFMVDVRDLG